jgi:hypothetical protein
VIFCTLVGQALSLAPLIRWLGIPPDNSLEHEEVEVRMLLATQTAAYLASSDGSTQAPADVLARMRTRYEIRLERLRNRASGVRASLLDEKPISQFQQLQETIIRFERHVLEQLRQEEKTSEEVLRKIENELDLEESRLASDKA